MKNSTSLESPITKVRAISYVLSYTIKAFKSKIKYTQSPYYENSIIFPSTSAQSTVSVKVCIEFFGYTEVCAAGQPPIWGWNWIFSHVGSAFRGCSHSVVVPPSIKLARMDFLLQELDIFQHLFQMMQGQSGYLSTWLWSVRIVESGH